ncbi:short-chain dehydrogenase/reductase SDR [Pseudopedobacter saltans DSM 12145]|uniref:Short-chain dehydrogenase/reductase SDR n=1 Tax=Pseudopedobacter saltans (strain ATCC 51119 / DSM 12145 / JCM 21818 / CCUG 39354 / LMG 10337 / NBRC 100064 / NCIMB 13643) TaxID=762903 RepID=F0S6J2_PSESL|nr:glucose 1-dehydrogenase [Pseudopedobacter saltans]ADY51068.1 short-chain dehydrogenase/reductase SDR [Pseudopedobacter saltans DSM 12145]
MFSLKNKSAVVTGGGSGIGKAIAENFAKNGATVHIIDLNLEQAQSTKNVIDSLGGSSLIYAADVSNQQEVSEIINKIEKVDILVNCAGIAHVGSATSTSEEDFDRVYRVNVKGTYNCLHEVLPKFVKQNSGVILNIASIAAWVGLSDRFAYSMSKGAVFAMTLSVAKDYLQNNIRCNSISPARVHTPFVDGFIAKNYPGQEKEMFDKLSKTQPIGRMGTTEEIANLALYLCSDEASFITGNDYPIDGGFIKLNS